MTELQHKEFKYTEPKANCLAVSFPDQPLWKPYFMDFLDTKIQTRLKTLNNQNPLVKAYRHVTGRHGSIVVDGTFGEGIDSLCFLKLGALVYGFEQNPVLYKLAVSALSRAKADGSYSFIGNLILSEGRFQDLGSRSDLAHSSESKVAKILYLDPLFEEIRDSKPKKSIQVFHELNKIFPFEKWTVDESLLPVLDAISATGIILKWNPKAQLPPRLNLFNPWIVYKTKMVQFLAAKRVESLGSKINKKNSSEDH